MDKMRAASATRPAGKVRRKTIVADEWCPDPVDRFEAEIARQVEEIERTFTDRYEW